MAVLGTARHARDRARLARRERARASCASSSSRRCPSATTGRSATHRPQKLARAQFVDEFIRDIRETHVEYGRTLRPGVLDRYRRQGYCMVMTMDLIRGRADAAGDRAALAYYARLEPRVRRRLRGQPVPRRRGSAAVQLRPLLQLLLARLRAARARDPDPPAARLRAALRAAEAHVVTVREDTGPAAAPGAPAAGRAAAGARRRSRRRTALALLARDPGRGARAAALAPRSRAAVRVQRRRGRALRAPCGGDVPRRARSGLLREPAGAHLPALRDLQGPLHRGLPVRRRERPRAQLRGRSRGRVPDRARRGRADRHARRRARLLGRQRASTSAASGSSPPR